jgi:hypothetical protein
VVERTWKSLLGLTPRETEYSVEQIAESRAEFGFYRYRIFKGNEEFAIFWHDYRGDCEGIRVLASGREENPPFGPCSDFLTGGGPYPLGLSRAAVEYLETLR